MFNLFKKKSQGEVVTLKIDGMHCTSCSMNIDGALEDTAGVVSARTNYAKGETKVEYDPAQVDVSRLKQVVEGLDYTVID